jgi:GTP cyclohydrolase IA
MKTNANEHTPLSDNDREQMEQIVAHHFGQILGALRIDTDNDHNTKETAQRVAKMYCREVFWGRFSPRPKITEFPNAKNLDQIYTLGPIQVRSACSHHFCPIMGKVWVGVIPSQKVIGISKFVRLADWVMSRPHIQEEAIVMLADELEALINPIGLAVVMKATHTCMTWRGVKETDTDMVTSVMRGEFMRNQSSKSEFLNIISSQGFK